MTRLRLRADGQVLQKTSRIAVLLLLAVVLVRMAVRQPAFQAAMGASSPLLATLLGDGLLGLALGLVVATHAELRHRARALLAERPGPAT